MEEYDHYKEWVIRQKKIEAEIEIAIAELRLKIRSAILGGIQGDKIEITTTILIK